MAMRITNKAKTKANFGNPKYIQAKALTKNTPLIKKSIFFVITSVLNVFS